MLDYNTERERDNDYKMMSLHSTVQQTDTGVCVSVCVRTKLLASGQKTEPAGRDDLYLLTSLS